MQNNLPEIDLTTEPWYTCEGDNSLFEPSLMFKRVSALLSATGTEEMATAQVIVCKKCGKIPPFFASKMDNVPAELVSECKK